MTTATASNDSTTEVRLSTLAGVHPSPEWLNACRSYLRERSNTNGVDDDAILHQILNADLRDVVRRLHPESSNARLQHPSSSSSSSSSLSSSSPAIQLRSAIAQSLPTVGSSNSSSSSSRGESLGPCKAVLPSSFRLMAQVEELLDVSLNAEARVSVGPASASSPTPVGNQRIRCLKLLLSDGYYNDGSFYNDENIISIDDDNQNSSVGHGSTPTLVNPIVAMETSPIQDLSVHSQPGIKILLRGEITIRLGVLMLHEGNTSVLGGCVPALIPVQRKAIEMARKLAGVGVDPTVKALIWNPHTGAEEDEDEGEEESRDVQAVPPAPVAAPSLPTRETESTIRNSPLRENQFHGQSVSSFAPNNQLLQQQPHVQINTITTQEGELENVSGSARTAGNDAPPPPQRISAPSSHTNVQPMDWSSTDQNTAVSSSSGLPRNDKTSSRPPNNPYSAGRNPYASLHPNRIVSTSVASSSSLSVTTTFGTDTVMTEATTPPPPTRRFSTSDFSTPRPGGESTSPCNNTMPPRIPKEHNALSLAPSGPGLDHDISSSQDSSNNPDDNTRLGERVQLSPTALSEPLSFSEMKSLLERARTDPELYGRYIGKTFIVPARTKGNQLAFNITKKEKKKSKLSRSRGDKYEYILHFHFWGTAAEDGIITCKIASDILEQFFGMSPSEMRKLNREDRARSQTRIQEGGRQVVGEFRTLGSLKMKFLLSKQEFFENGPPEIDGPMPVLLVIGRDPL